jgi:hypothetical protein
LTGKLVDYSAVPKAASTAEKKVSWKVETTAEKKVSWRVEG